MIFPGSGFGLPKGNTKQELAKEKIEGDENREEHPQHPQVKLQDQ